LLRFESNKIFSTRQNLEVENSRPFSTLSRVDDEIINDARVRTARAVDRERDARGNCVRKVANGSAAVFLDFITFAVEVIAGSETVAVPATSVTDPNQDLGAGP